MIFYLRLFEKMYVRFYNDSSQFMIEALSPSHIDSVKYVGGVWMILFS